MPFREILISKASETHVHLGSRRFYPSTQQAFRELENRVSHWPIAKVVSHQSHTHQPSVTYQHSLHGVLDKLQLITTNFQPNTVPLAVARIRSCRTMVSAKYNGVIAYTWPWQQIIRNDARMMLYTDLSRSFWKVRWELWPPFIFPHRPTHWSK